MNEISNLQEGSITVIDFYDILNISTYNCEKVFA